MNDLLDETAALAAASTEAMGAVCSLDNYLAQPDHTMDARTVRLFSIRRLCGSADTEWRDLRFARSGMTFRQKHEGTEL